MNDRSSLAINPARAHTPKHQRAGFASHFLGHTQMAPSLEKFHRETLEAKMPGLAELGKHLGEIDTLLSSRGQDVAEEQAAFRQVASAVGSLSQAETGRQLERIRDHTDLILRLLTPQERIGIDKGALARRFGLIEDEVPITSKVELSSDGKSFTITDQGLAGAGDDSIKNTLAQTYYGDASHAGKVTVTGDKVTFETGLFLDHDSTLQDTPFLTLAFEGSMQLANASFVQQLAKEIGGKPIPSDKMGEVLDTDGKINLAKFIEHAGGGADKKEQSYKDLAAQLSTLGINDIGEKQSPHEILESSPALVEALEVQTNPAGSGQAPTAGGLTADQVRQIVKDEAGKAGGKTQDQQITDKLVPLKGAHPSVFTDAMIADIKAGKDVFIPSTEKAAAEALAKAFGVSLPEERDGKYAFKGADLLKNLPKSLSDSKGVDYIKWILGLAGLGGLITSILNWITGKGDKKKQTAMIETLQAKLVQFLSSLNQSLETTFNKVSMSIKNLTEAAQLNNKSLSALIKHLSTNTTAYASKRSFASAPSQLVQPTTPTTFAADDTGNKTEGNTPPPAQQPEGDPTKAVLEAAKEQHQLVEKLVNTPPQSSMQRNMMPYQPHGGDMDGDKSGGHYRPHGGGMPQSPYAGMYPPVQPGMMMPQMMPQSPYQNTGAGPYGGATNAAMYPPPAQPASTSAAGFAVPGLPGPYQAQMWVKM